MSGRAFSYFGQYPVICVLTCNNANLGKNFDKFSQEFNETFKFVENIHPKSKKYGMSRIVPPHSWKPPYAMLKKDGWESASFRTQIQRIDGLPTQSQDKLAKICKKINKKIGSSKACLENGSSKEYTSNLEKVECLGNSALEAGLEFTLLNFKKCVDDFKNRYFGIQDGSLEDESKLSPEIIEVEYRRIVENPTEQMKVYKRSKICYNIFRIYVEIYVSTYLLL